MSDPDDAKSRASPIPLAGALVSILALIGALCLVILWPQLDGDPATEPGTGHFPLLFAGCVASGVAWIYGWSWREIRTGILHAINLAMGAILILLVIGVLIGTWMAAGIVPALIDWGLWLLEPSIFLPASCVVCSVVSLVSGSSWSTAGTVGLALIGVGSAMQVDPAYTAGAVISGSYFGDKLSPMSDTTNLAPAMAGTDLFTHIRHMLWTTTPSLVIALIGYTILGLSLGEVRDTNEISAIRHILQVGFDPGLLHLLAPGAVALLVLRKMPALPTLLLGATLGGVVAVLAYDLTLAQVLEIAMSGYKPKTGDAAVDELLARGGMSSMSDTVLLVLCAMVFGGVMERTGQLRVIASRVLTLAKSSGSLIATTVLTSIGMNILAADQYIAVIVPGRMYAQAYADRGLHPKNLSRALEDGGTITSPLIPWNTCGAFMSGTLGVATGAYLPYCFLNLANPVIGIVLGLTGWTVAKLPPPKAGSSPKAL
jgi:NhaC family Na+:H+ antiporter